MARVTTYATLATAIQEYMARADIGVASGNLDYLCSEAEEEMNARLRVRRMLTTVTPTVSSAGVVTLPTDFGGWVRFRVSDGTSIWDLDLVASEQTTEVLPYSTITGVPKALITNGATSQILPYTDAVYTFSGLYYGLIPALTSVATTNWVITNFPNAYLYGCLTAARGLVQDDSPTFAARFDRWEKRFAHAIDRIIAANANDYDARKSAVALPDTSMFGGSNRSNIQADT